MKQNKKTEVKDIEENYMFIGMSLEMCARMGIGASIKKKDSEN